MRLQNIAMMYCKVIDRDLFAVAVLLPQSITNQRVNAMICRTKPPQLHSLSILDFFGVRISPFNGDVAVRICVHQDIEGTIPAQLG